MESKKPDVLLASFPRSGNTYLRNILYDVYGIYSWNNLRKYYNNFDHIDELKKKISRGKSNDKKLNRLAEMEQLASSRVMKTHERPGNILPECSPGVKIIYLIRDGRDACISSAHHRSDIVSPGSDFLGNLRDAILASMGTHFGGWSKNVEEWMEVAHKVIFFEDLVHDPIGTVEQLRDVLPLPEPDVSRLPTFESQREGSSHFGGGARPQLSDEERENFNKKFFRSGKIGGWKDEMPVDIQELYWEKHGSISESIGYMKDGTINRP